MEVGGELSFMSQESNVQHGQTLHVVIVVLLSYKTLIHDFNLW